MTFWKKNKLLILSIAFVYTCAFFYISVLDAALFSDFGYPVHNGGDSSEYAILSQNVAERGMYTLAPDSFVPEMFRAPGYSAFLVPLFLLDESFFLAIVAQIFLTIGSALLMYRIGVELLPPVWAFVSTLLFVFDPTTIFYSLSIWSDTLFVCMLLASVYLIFVREGHDWIRVALVGALLGGATLVRPAGGYLILIFALFFVATSFSQGIHFKKYILMVLVMILVYSTVLTPWYVRNFYYSNGSIGISSTGAHAILLYDVHDFLMMKNNHSSVEVNEEILAQLPTRDKDELRNIQYVDEMMGVAKKYILQYPLEYGVYHLMGGVNLYLSSSIRDALNNLPVAHSTLQALSLVGSNETNVKALFMQNPLKAVWFSLSQEPLLTLERILRLLTIALALGGLCFGLYYKKNRARFLLVLCALLIVYTALVIGPVSYPRYRMSAEPFLFLIAGVGAVALLEKVRSKDRQPQT